MLKYYIVGITFVIAGVTEPREDKVQKTTRMHVMNVGKNCHLARRSDECMYFRSFAERRD